MRRLAILAAAVIVAAPTVLSVHRAGAAGQAVGTGRYQITVLGQSPWVESGQSFQLRLRVAAPDPINDRLSVQVFSRLTTRTDFDNALAGRTESYIRYGPDVHPLSQLPADPSGGIDVTIPVNPTVPPAPGAPFPPFNAVGGSGVFPLQVNLYDAAGVPQARPLTTFLVYAAGDASSTGFPRLSVSPVVAVRASPVVNAEGSVGPVSTADSTRLSQLVAVLSGHPDVPLSLAVSPAAVDALASGSATDKATLSALGALGRSGADQVLPATYARVSASDLIFAGLSGELSEQFRSGDSTLSRVFGPRDPSVWVLDGGADQATVNALIGRGAARLVMPDSALTPLPNAVRQTTFALPTRLDDVARSGDAAPSVYAADSRITADFDNGGGSVLAASQLLAELAMIQLETPGVTRGVAVVAPSGWTADPAFVETLASGLSGHPLLKSVTVSQLFTSVKQAQVGRSLSAPPGRDGQSPSAPPSTAGGEQQAQNPSSTQPTLAGDAASIRAARRAVQAFSTVVAGDQSVAGPLGTDLLVAESLQVTERQRQTILAAIQHGAGRVLKGVTLPRASSITLTSTRGQVPLTILSNGAVRAHVELRLTSQRLIFKPFSPPGGHCRVPTPTSEVCDLVIAGQNTTLKVPVETRSSGVFPLDVSLWTPGGAELLARVQNTVRSTAVSGVGVVLIILAVGSLALWWGRDLRHGRRARKLVPAPDPDEPELHADDPLVREFFEKPPPGYGGAGAPRAEPRA